MVPTPAHGFLPEVTQGLPTPTAIAALHVPLPIATPSAGPCEDVQEKT